LADIPVYADPLLCATPFALAGGVRRLLIFSLEDNIFTSSTCRAASDYAHKVLRKLHPDFEVVRFLRHTSLDVAAPGHSERLASEVVASGADAVLGCDLQVMELSVY
jgi:hypothetical protein